MSSNEREENVAQNAVEEAEQIKKFKRGSKDSKKIRKCTRA
jgi:hypothetical protein